MTTGGSFSGAGGRGGGAGGAAGGGKEAKFWYIGSKFVQERAKFSNLKWERELSRKLEQLANDERTRMYELQQEIYAVRGIYRCQKMERWSSRLNAELTAAADEAGGDGHRRDAEPLGDWVDAHGDVSAAASAVSSAAATAPFPVASAAASSSASVASDGSAAIAGRAAATSAASASRAAAEIGRSATPAVHEREGRRQAATPTLLQPPGAEAVALHTRGGFIYRPVLRPRSIREAREVAAERDDDDDDVPPPREQRAVRKPSSSELLMSLLGDKFASEDAIRDRIARRHKVDFYADEYTDGALAYAKRRFHVEKNRFFSRNAKVADLRREAGEGKSERADIFRLDEKKLKRLQVAQQQILYDRSLRRVESFLGVATSPTSRRASQPMLTEREARVISLLQASVK